MEKVMKDYNKYKACDADASPVDDDTVTYVIGKIITPAPDIGYSKPVSILEDDEEESD